MAKCENNEVMFGARGKIGNLVVFKNFGKDQTVIAKTRRKPQNPVYSLQQEETKSRFKEAVIYAQGITADEGLLAFYKKYAKPGTSAYNMALADFCKPPVIENIDITGYQGNIGDKIKIRAIDNFRVVSVKFSIFGADNQLIETGNAVLSANNADWNYETTVANAAVQQSRFVAEATDTPGNVTISAS